MEVGTLQEIDHRHGREPGAPDRPHRHRPHHRIEDGDRHAADVQPQLPGLLVTVPGATRPHREHSAFFNSQDSLSTEVNGQSRLANNTMIEGVDDNQKTGLLQVIIPAADALETVSVTTSNYDAEFGRSGGAITNVTLKSGTNALQGHRLLLRQQREDQRRRLLLAPQGADQVRQRRLHARRPDHPQQAVLLRRLPADDRQLRLRRPHHRADRRRCATATSARCHSTSTTRSPAMSAAPTARRSPTTRSRRIASARSRSSCWRSSRCRTSRRRARPEQLPAGADAREDDRRIRREGQLHDQRRRTRCPTA